MARPPFNLPENAGPADVADLPAYGF